MNRSDVAVVLVFSGVLGCPTEKVSSSAGMSSSSTVVGSSGGDTLLPTSSPDETSASSSTSDGFLDPVPCGEAEGLVCGDPEARLGSVLDLRAVAGCEVWQGGVFLGGEVTREDCAVEPLARFFGRTRRVEAVDEPAPEPKQLALFVPRGHVELPATTTLLEAQLRDAAPSRLSWMRLLARVFRIDISGCARCSGPMKVTRFVTTPEEIAAELHGARPPPRGPVPGQLLLFSAVA